MANPLSVLLIGNFADRRCGFRNFTDQMQTAMAKYGGATVVPFDGTYTTVYARQQQKETHYRGMFPDDVEQYNVVHLVWNAMTMNHYAGAPWDDLKHYGITTSWWDGGPSDASCPFIDHMQVRWSDYPRPGYEYMHYPVPDWVEDLPEPATAFTVGASSVRGDGVAEIREICERRGWALNLPEPGQWLSVDDEVRRLARSSVNVCWYNTPPLWHNRASAPSMLLAAKRPILINQDPLVAHLHEYTAFAGVYCGVRGGESTLNMEACLTLLEQHHRTGQLNRPLIPFEDLCWERAAARFVAVWREAVDHGR